MRSPRQPARLLPLLPWLLLAACFAASIFYSRQGWSLPLTDHWRFRETQTALGARSILEDGPRLDYETPVLGAPWSIPFEFPTYQVAVALVTRFSGLPLDQSGRLVSLAAAYLAFLLLGWLTTRLSGSRAAGLFTAAFALVSPVYLYGSRAFMIESTALCLTLAFLLGVDSFLRRPRITLLPFVLLFGALAGATKATTYAVGLCGVVVLLALHAPSIREHFRSPRPRRLLAGLAATLALGFALTFAWIRYTDVLKRSNEFAAFITSDALRAWNFGTWAQRFELRTWDQMFHWVSNFVLGTSLAWTLALAVVAAAAGLQRRLILGLLAIFASGLLVFTNLYVVHEYYHYANGVYLLAVVGVACGTLWDRAAPFARLAVGLFVAPLFATFLLGGYVARSLPQQLQVDQPLLDLATGIREHVPADHAIVVYGAEWESTLPYYAERHALLDRYNLHPSDPMLQRALARLDRPLGGVVFAAFYRDDWWFIQHQIRHLGTGRQRLLSSTAGELYPAADPPALQSPAWLRSGFDPAPGVFESRFPLSEASFDGRSAMLVHAPGFLALPREAQHRELEVGFGLLESAYTAPNATDGVSFAVDFVDRDKRRTRLFERRLDPVRHPADRGPQSARIPLPPDTEGSILLIGDPAGTASFDWAVWRDVKLR